MVLAGGARVVPQYRFWVVIARMGECEHFVTRRILYHHVRRGLYIIPPVHTSEAREPSESFLHERQSAAAASVLFLVSRDRQIPYVRVRTYVPQPTIEPAGARAHARRIEKKRATRSDTRASASSSSSPAPASRGVSSERAAQLTPAATSSE